MECESRLANRIETVSETKQVSAPDYFYESFESDPFPPANWTIVNVSGTDVWGRWYYVAKPSTKFAAVGNFEATISSPVINWLITPRLLVEHGDSLRFSLYTTGYTGVDSIYVLISINETFEHDSASLKKAFSDTLLALNVNTGYDSWKVLTASLEKYAGKNIYIGFYSYAACNRMNCLDDISVGKFPAVEGSIFFVTAPPMTGIDSVCRITAEIFSYGSLTNNFDVHFEIPEEDYSKIITVDNISVYSRKTAVFDWIPSDTGKYNIRIYIKAPGDNNPSNDSAFVSIKTVEYAQGPKWRSETELPVGRYYHGSASYMKKSGIEGKIDTGYIFIMGGQDASSNVLQDIMKYNTISRKWSKPDTSLPVPLYAIKAVQIKGKIYIPGGAGSGVLSSKLYIYDIEEDKITQGADMLYSARGYALGVWGDSLIYLMGGAWPDVSGAVVQIYNINTNSWSTGPAINGAPVFYLNGTVCGDKIVLSGEIASILTENYLIYGVIDSLNPYNITWSAERNYPSGDCSSVSAGSWNGINNKYFFFSQGKYNSVCLKDTWLYDVKHNKWKACSPKITGGYLASDMVAVVRNDSAFLAVTGGYNSNGNTRTNEWLYIGPSDLDSSVIGTAEEPNSPTPVLYSLSQNYPNPFNPSTTIKYSIAEAGKVELKIYNMLGQEITTLVNEMKNAGQHEVKFNAAGINLSSGVYIYRIKSGSFVQTKKLMLIK
ncbi:MAG TPA: choice-of-anchor J domain-containing protein [Ignavibacteriales bacterium]|nr:choice-of-anchor J domain-containing protein [Ignavibacteriales bacterium]